MAADDTLLHREIKERRIVGKMGARQVMEVETVGGRHVIFASAPSGAWQSIGAGNHRCLARFQAQRHNPDLVFTDLAKSEEYPVSAFRDQIPESLALTNAFRARQGLPLYG